MLQISRVRHMRSPAEVDIVALFVEGDRLALRQIVDESHFVVLTASEFKGASVFPTHLFPDNGQFFVREFAHFLFDTRQILLLEGLRQIKIVVETILNRGSDSEFDAREKLPNRLRHQVGCAVPQIVERIAARVVIHSNLLRSFYNCKFSRSSATL